jgi:hypothetical protein
LLSGNAGNSERVRGSLLLRIAGVVGLLVSLSAAAVVATRTIEKTHPALDTARASTSCAPRLVADWSDGRIDGIYPIRCYRAALKSLPTDLQVYSSAPDDIAQALSQRIVQSHAKKSSDKRNVRRLAGAATKK